MNCQTGKSWARLTSVSLLLAVLWIATHSLFAAPLITTASAGNAVPVWALIVGIRDTSDNPLSGGFVRTYTTGTNASKSTYLNATKTRTAPNPIVLDAYGRASGNSGIGPIYADGTYRFVICASDSTVLYTIDGLEFKSVANPGDVNYTNSIIASLTATRIQIDGGIAADMTIDDSTITNSDITNASMSTVDMTGVVRIDQASITVADLGTTNFTGAAGSVGHIPGTTATFSGDVTVSGEHRVSGNSWVTGNTTVGGYLAAGSGTWLIGYDIWLNNIGGYIYGLATPTLASQAVNKGYVDVKDEIVMSVASSAYANTVSQGLAIAYMQATDSLLIEKYTTTYLYAPSEDVSGTLVTINPGATWEADSTSFTNVGNSATAVVRLSADVNWTSITGSGIASYPVVRAMIKKGTDVIAKKSFVAYHAMPEGFLDSLHVQAVSALAPGEVATYKLVVENGGGAAQYIDVSYNATSTDVLYGGSRYLLTAELMQKVK